MDGLENIQEIYPLAPAQAGMLFHAVGDDGPAGAYIGVILATLKGELDPARLEAAFSRTFMARDALRAGFVWEGLETPVQAIHRDLTVPWRTLDWRDKPAADQKADLDALIEAERRQGFDLAAAPLLRCCLIRTDQRAYQLVWTCHHLICDGWSAAILLEDAFAAYAAGDPAEHIDTTAKFRDFLAWRQRRDTGSEQEFWTDYLAGMEPAASQGHSGGQLQQSERLALDPEMTAKAENFARAERTTLATLLLAAWALTLRRYSRRDDVVLGLTTAGRPADIPGVERAVGAYVNTLPFRIAVDGAWTVGEYVAAAQKNALARQRHEFSALADVLAWSPVASGAELFQALFVFESTPKSRLDAGDIEVADLEVWGPSNYPLALVVAPGPALGLELIYDAGIYDGETAQSLLADFETTLSAMLAGRETALADLAMTPPATLAHLTGALADGGEMTAAFEPLHEQIAGWGAKTPSATAVVFDGDSLAYSALAGRMAEIAAHLADIGVGKGDVVAIGLPRGVDGLAAMLGVLTAGAAYMPLDLDYPADRLAQMFAAAQPKAVLTTAELAAKLPETAATLVFTDAIVAGRAGPAVAVGPEDAAYVIFTSGSQGRPKGVVVSHGALHASNAARAQFYPTAPDAFLMLSSFAFDSSVAGTYWTLASGGRLVLSGVGLEQDSAALGRTIAQNGVTHMLCLPGLYRAMLETIPHGQLASLETVIVAGEAASGALAAAHREALPAARLVNEYGPTEATVWCVAGDITEIDGDANAPIGRPIPGARAYVLDADGRPAPLGVAGELFIGGAGVAQGYIGDAEASAAAFRRDPFLEGGDGRIYRTGDLAVWRKDGALDYLGRVDEQVKIRGHRVELAEIEAVAEAAAPGLEAAAIAIPSERSARLALFFAAPDPSVEPESVRTAIAAKLPAFMVPASATALPALPRLPNGKVDRGRLAELAATPPEAGTSAVAPAGFAETTLAKVWREVLGVEAVGVDDNFFDLGGDSLTSIKVMAAAARAGLQLAPQDLFQFPTVASLAAHLERQAGQPVENRGDNQFSIANPDGAEPAFFMMHGAPEMFMFLANGLGRERPLGFLFGHMLAGDVSPLATIASLADEAKQRLRRLKPEGPYAIGGYSLGGLLAIELARQLQEEGEQVDLLFLLDPSPLTHEVRAAQGRPYRLHRLWRLARSAALVALGYMQAPFDFRDRDLARRRIVRRVYSLALARYRPEPVAGRTMIVSSTTFQGAEDWQRKTFDAPEIVGLDFDHLALQWENEALFEWTSKLAAALKSV